MNTQDAIESRKTAERIDKLLTEARVLSEELARPEYGSQKIANSADRLIDDICTASTRIKLELLMECGELNLEKIKRFEYGTATDAELAE